ncbi:MAG: Ig-like domain-containing protein [Burkholderiales bacterium]
MKLLWRYLKQQKWLMALPLLLTTGYGATALAAQAPSFSATASGTTNNLTLTADMNVGDADLGKNGNTYLGFNFNQTWYFNNGTGWVQFNSGALPIYAAAPLVNRSMEVVRNADLTSLIGGQVYVGYGLTENDMLANSKYAMVYTVRADIVPLVSGTFHINNQTNVPINTSVGVTFSESLDPLTITNTNFTLKETVSGATVAGTVGYSGVNAVFVPSANLASNTSYTVTVKGGAGGVKDLAGHTMASDFVISWTTGATTDTTAPMVSGTLHTNGQTGVPLNTSIGLTFSKGMDPATITNANFSLKQTVSGAAVAGTVTYAGVSAAFTPSAALASNTSYTVTVKGGAGGVKDLAGNLMAGDFVSSWTTGAVIDTTAPTVSGTSNANGATNVPINSQISITFSEGMDPATINNTNIEMRETKTAAAVPGIVAYSGVTATFVPLNTLAYDTSYILVVSGGANGVKDLAGNAMTSILYSWTTGTPNIAPAVDTTAPTLADTSNANGATNVAINTHPGATFSEAMDPLSMTNVNFTLKETVSGTPVAGTVSYAGLTAVFVPLNNLANNTSYTATIKSGVNGAKDLAGNALAADYVWSWTTAAAADTTPPTVTGTSNANGAINVATNIHPGATFSEAMDPLSMTNVNFTLKETVSGTPVAGTVSYAGLTAVFVPLNNLANNTSYTATIKSGVNGAKDLAGNALALDYVWGWTTATVLRSPVLLGTAGNFAILAKTAVSTVPQSVITGDVGVSPAATSYLTGFSLSLVGTTSATSTQVTGNLYGADMTPPTNSNLTTAVSDMEAAYTDAAGRITPDFLNLGSGNIGGLTLAPGLYTWGSSVTIPANVTISGGANDVWIFQMSGDLIMSAAKSITLSGGAQAKNIFWQVAGQATLGAGAHFEGNILSQTAISLQTGATMNGRALAQSQVALQSATITKPAP